MLTPICQDNIVTGLCPTVITHNNACLILAGKKIGQQAFACIPETQINNNVGAQRKETEDCLREQVGQPAALVLLVEQNLSQRR